MFILLLIFVYHVSPSGEMCLLEPLVPGCDTGDQIGEVWDLLGPPSLQEQPFSLQYYFLILIQN